MIYNTQNSAGSLVYDVEARQQITRVISVDTRAGRVEVARYVDGHYVVDRERGEIETDVIEFGRIDTEIDMGLKIKAFHCHGRKA